MIRAAVKRIYKCMLDICGSFGSDAVGNSSSSRNNEVTMGRAHSADAPPVKRSKRIQEKSSPRSRGSGGGAGGGGGGGGGGGCSVFSGGGGGGGGGPLGPGATAAPQASPCLTSTMGASTRARQHSSCSARRRTPCVTPPPPVGAAGAAGAAAGAGPPEGDAGADGPAAGGHGCGGGAPSRANIGDLPPEVLLEVFSYFNVQELEGGVSRVCELWRDLSRRACLRRELALDGETVDTAAACELLRGCPHLEALVIAGRADAEALLRQVAMHNRELRRLAIKRCYGSPSRPYLAAQLLNKLLRRCPRLVDLTIKQSIFRSNKFFRDLGVMLPDIRRINLNFSSSFGSDALKMIALRCGKLEEIRALRKRTPNSTVPHCCDQDAALLAQRLCSTLRVLKLDGAMLSDEGLSALAQCAQLRTLYVRHAYSVTDAGAAHLARLRRLESLDLTGMGQVSPAGWARLFGEARWTGMRRLSLALCLTVNDETLRHVSAACPRLLKLVLAGCMHVTEDGLTAVIQTCALLECLNICLAHVYVFSSFVWIPSHTPHLRRLVYHPYGLEEENLILKFLAESLPALDIVRVEHPVEGIIREM